MADCKALKRQIGRGNELKRKGERLDKDEVELEKEVRDHAEMVDSMDTGKTSKQETKTMRMRNKLQKHIEKLEGQKKFNNIEQEVNNKAILEEAERLREQVLSELHQESLQHEFIYQKENEAVLEWLPLRKRDVTLETLLQKTYQSLIDGMEGEMGEKVSE